MTTNAVSKAVAPALPKTYMETGNCSPCHGNNGPWQSNLILDNGMRTVSMGESQLNDSGNVTPPFPYCQRILSWGVLKSMLEVAPVRGSFDLPNQAAFLTGVGINSRPDICLEAVTDAGISTPPMGSEPKIIPGNSAHLRDNALHLAAQRGDFKEIIRLIDKGSMAVNAIDDLGNTPMHYAKDTLTVELLINRGASPYIRNKNNKNVTETITDESLRFHVMDYFRKSGATGDGKKMFVIEVLWTKKEGKAEAEVVDDEWLDASIEETPKESFEWT